jgi:hypothetical protein
VGPDKQATPADVIDVYSAIVGMAPHGKAPAAPRGAAALVSRIRSLGVAAVEPLIRASRHPDATVRMYAFRLLSFLRDRRVADRMLEAVRFDEPLLAMYAIQKLAGDGDRRVLRPLREHIAWLERLTATAPLPFSAHYTDYCLYRYFLADARDALESLGRRAASAAG